MFLTMQIKTLLLYVYRCARGTIICGDQGTIQESVPSHPLLRSVCLAPLSRLAGFFNMQMFILSIFAYSPLTWDQARCSTPTFLLEGVQ